MHGCKYCKMNGKYEEYCMLTGEPTKGEVKCDFEYEDCPEYQNALKPIKAKSEPKPKSPPQLTQTSIYGAAGEKPF